MAPRWYWTFVVRFFLGLFACYAFWGIAELLSGGGGS